MSDYIQFKGQGIKITDSGVQIGRNSYPRESITSATVAEKPMSIGQRIGAVVAGLVLCVIVAVLPRDAVFCGAPLAILGLAFLFSGAVGTKSYVLNVGTTDGEITVLTSTTQGKVRKVQRALEQYVIQAGQGNLDAQ